MIHFAAKYNCEKFISYIIENGGNVNCVDSRIYWVYNNAHP